MKASSSPSRHALRWHSLLAAVFAMLLIPAAHAVLGGSVESVVTDQSRFKAARSAVAGGPYTTHAIRLGDGSGINEYVNAAGVVFAVSWRTRLKPDLAALIGPQFAAHAATVPAPAGVAASKRQQSIRQPTLVVHQAGRMNAFAGIAYDPTLVPEGVDADTLR